MAYTLQENNTAVEVSAATLSSATYHLAQTFTAASSYTLTKVELLLYREGTPPTNLTVEIQATTAGAPNNSVLSTQTVNVSAITTDTAGEWVAVTIATPVALTSSTVYAIVITDGYSSSNNWIKWRQNSQNPFANGSGYYSTLGSTYTIQSGYDRGFKNYSGTASVYVYLAGTVAAVSTVTGRISRVGISPPLGSGHKVKHRLIAVGNNQFWYEDV